MSIDWAVHQVLELGRRWEPNAHPRLPLGPGGGQFKSIWSGPSRDKPTRFPTRNREAAKRGGWWDPSMESMFATPRKEAELQRRAAPALGHMEQLAPGAYAKLDHLWLQSHGNRGNLGEYNDYDGGEPIIHITQDLLTKSTREDFEKMRDQGFTAPWPQGMDPVERTVIHEFGHHLEWYAGKHGEERRKWLQEARSYGLPIGVGGRANQGDPELLAELWTEYATMGPNARPAAQAVGRMMQEAGSR